MRRIFFLTFLLVLNFNMYAQRQQFNCNICLDNTSFCNTTFNLVSGNTYTFTTGSFTGSNYSWSTTGSGLVIVGSRNQQTVQVQAVSATTSQICLTKSVDGKHRVAYAIQ